MKISVLTENTCCQPQLQAEHGLSLYMEVGQRRILFDMGQSGAFVDNALKMGIDLRQVDLAVISHGHYDHGGGLGRFLEINSRAKVYLSPYAMGRFYNKTGKYIGLDGMLAGDSRLVFVEQELALGDGCVLRSGNGLPQKFPCPEDGLHVERDGGLMEDDFCHELYLCIEEGQNRVCFTGCGHRGVENILCWTGADVLVGGLHLRNMEQVELAALARRLEKRNVQIYTGHCTGELPLEYLTERLGVKPLTTGVVYEIGEVGHGDNKI